MKTTTCSFLPESKNCGKGDSLSSWRAIPNEPQRAARAFRPILLALTAIVLGGSPSLHAADRTWGNTATDYNAGASWTGAAAPGASDAAVFSSAVTNQPALSANITNQQIRFTTSTGGWTLNGTSALTLTSTGTGTTAGTGSAIVGTNTSGTNTINAAIILGGAAATTTTLNQTASGTLAITGNISSTNAITGISLTGASGSVFTLAGNNTYSGTTTLSSASIKLNINSATAIGAGALVFGASATIDNTSGAAITLANNNNISLGVNNLTFTGTHDLSFGSGTATLGSSRSIIVSAGNLTIGSMNADFTNVSLTKSGAGTLILTNAAGANFQGGTTLSVGGGLSLGHKNALGTGALALSGTLSARTDLSGANAVGNTVSLNANSAIAGSNNMTLSGALTNNGSGRTLTINNAGATELSGPIYLSENSSVGRTLTVATTTNATISGAISNFNGSGTAGGLTKSLAGTLTLTSASSNYTGVTTMIAGVATLAVSKLADGGQNSSIGASSNAASKLMLGNGAILSYIGSGDSTDRLFTIDGSSAGHSAKLDASGSGAINFTNTGGLAYSTTSQTRTLWLQGSSTANNTFAPLIANNGSGAVSLNKAGTGTWVLTGNNTYTGATAVLAGALTMGHANALGTTAGGVTVSDGAALQFTGSIAVGAEPLNITGDGIGSGGALRNLSGTNSYAGAITLAGATRINSDSGTLTLSGAIGGNTQNLTIGGAGNTTISNAIGTATGTLTKDGAGTLILSGANTLTGGVTINAGSIQIGNAGALNSTAGSQNAITFGASSTSVLSLNGTSIAIRSLNSNATPGTPVVQNANASAATLTIGNSANAASIYDGVIQDGTGGGALGLAKAGTGTLTLTGNNTYSGGTTLSAGTLALGQKNALGTGTLTISAASTALYSTTDLGGANAVANAVNLRANSSIVGSNNLTLSGALTQNGSSLSLTVNNAGATELAGPIYLSENSSVGRTLTLVATTNTTVSGAISDFNGSGTAGVFRKNGAGALVLSNSSSSYTGRTETQAGGILSVAKLANGGSNSSIGASSNAVGNLVLANGTTLLYTGSGDSTDRLFTIDGSGAGLGVAIDASGSGALNFTNTGSFVSQSTGQTRTLTLQGSSTANNTFAPVVANNGAGVVSLVKSGAGTWVLTGNKTYTGTTTINAGTLQFAKTASLYNATTASWTASNIIVNSGATLALNVGGTGEFTTGNVTSLLTNLGGLGGTVTNNGLQAGSFIAFDTTNASGSNFAISNNIANSTGSGGGAIGLAKLGTGTLTISGNSTYTGSTSINAGTLEIASAGRLGGGSYSGDITNNGTFIYSGTSSQTLAGVISGSGALTQNNTAGTLTLSGTNTYTGATTVSAGTLSVLGSVSASSAITINNTGALSGNGTVGIITVNSGGSINPGAAVGTINTGGITLNGGGSYNWQLMNAGGTAGSDWDLIGSTGALTIGANATNRFTINISTVQNQAGTAGTASGFVSSQNYSWRLAEFGSAISGFDANFFTLNATGFQNSRSGNFALDVSGNFLNLLYTTSLTGYTYTAGSGSWSTTTNWDPNGTPTSASALTFNGTGGTSTNDLLSSVQSIDIASSAGSYTLAGSGNGSTITLNGGITSSSSNDQTISMGINLGADQTFQADAGNLLLSGALATSNYTLTVAGAGNVSITNTISGNGALLKSSLGRLALDGNNTYTGATTINAGTLEISSAGRLGGGSYSGDITNNGTFIYSGANSQTLAGVISGSGALTQNNSSSTLTLSGNNTYTGATTINAGTLTLSGGLSNSSVTVNGGMLNQTSTGTIAGTGITFTLASGNAILSGNNTYTGATTINAGTLEIASTGRLGGGSYSGDISNSGTLIYSGSNSQTLAGVISGSGALTQNNSSSTLTLSGNNTYNGTTTINAGTLQVGLSGRLGGGNYSGSITNNGTLLHFGSNNQTLAGVISGTGQLTQSGANSTLTLSGNNTYSGITTVSGNSILNIRHNNALGGTANGTTVASGSALQLQNNITIAGETLTLNGPGLGSSNTGALRNISGDNEWTENITIGSAATRIAADAGNLAISGNIINNAGGSLSFQGQSGSSGNITVSGIISGSGSLSTSGLAINLLTLSNNNTYTGLSTINAGVVSINSIKDVGAGASSLGAPITTANGIIAMGTTITGATLRYTGADTSSNRTINLAGTTGGATIDQSGTGTLTFTSNFTATGAGSKTLTLQGSTAGIGEIAGAVVNNNSTNTTSLTKNGTGTWILSGANTYTGATTINAGTLQIGNGSSTGNLSASSTITNNGTLVFNRSGTVTQGQDFASGISGTGNLTQAGTGNLILNAANSYSGVTSITAGNLSITTASALANTSAINLANATALNYTGSADTLDRTISVTGGTGTIRNTGDLLTLSGSITKNGTTLTLAGGSSGITVSGVISGSSANSDLVIDGGTTTLTNTNTYNGPTTIINSGTLNANAAGALPTGTLSSITINGDSTLALGANQSIASLNGTSGSNVNLNTNTLTINGSASSTYSGGISGSGSLVKDGSGTQSLAGATTFTGTTTVNSGTLTAAAAGALGASSNIDINSGSLLVTVGSSINDSAAINLNSGTLAVNGDFNETVGALTLSANSIIDLNGFSGILRFSGLSWASGASNATLAIWNWSGTPQHGPPVNDYTNPSHVVFTSDANLTSENLAKISFYSGNGIGFVGNAFADSFSQSGFATSTQIIPVPEPETYLTCLILFLGFGIYQFRLARQGRGHFHRFTCLRHGFKRKSVDAQPEV